MKTKMLAIYERPDTYRGYSKIYTFDRKILELIDIDHDAGDYAKDSGDYIKLLD